jgi:hypothetical protein
MRRSFGVSNTTIETNVPFELSSVYDGIYCLKPDDFDAFNLVGRQSDWKYTDIDKSILFSTNLTIGSPSLVAGDISERSLRLTGVTGTGVLLKSKIIGLSTSADVYVSVNVKVVTGTFLLNLGNSEGTDEYGSIELAASTSYTRKTAKLSGVDKDNFYLSVMLTGGTADIYIDSIVVVDITSKPLSDLLATAYGETNYDDLSLSDLDEIFSGNVLEELTNKGYAIPEIDGVLMYDADVYFDNKTYAKTSYFFKDLSEIDTDDITATESGDYMHIYFELGALDIVCGIDNFGRKINKETAPTTRGIDYSSNTIHISLLKSDLGISTIDKYNAKRIMNGYTYISSNWKSPEGTTVTEEYALNTESSSPMLVLFEKEEETFEIDAAINIQREDSSLSHSYASPAIVLEPIISGYTSRNLSEPGLRQIRHIVVGDSISSRVTTLQYYWDYSEWDNSTWS